MFPPAERDYNSLARCEYLDLAVAWIDDADWPTDWHCPQCGGQAFVAAHRDGAR